MTNVVKHNSEGKSNKSLVQAVKTKLTKSVAPKIGRSSLIFVALTSVIFWLIFRLGIVLTNDILIDATKWSLSIAIYSCVARSIFQATSKLQCEKVMFATQYLYVLFLILAAVPFSFFLFRLLPGEFYADRIPISVMAIWGTLIVDSLYNAMIDVVLPPMPATANAIKSAKQKMIRR